MNAWLVLLALAGAPDEAEQAKDDASPCRVVLDVELSASVGLEREPLELAIARESRCALDTSASSDAAHLGVRFSDATHAHLAMTRADGRHLERDVVLDADDAERVRAIAIVAAHMLRNEADELLAELGSRRRETEPPVEDAVPVEEEPLPAEEAPIEEPPVEETTPLEEPTASANAPGPPIVRIALGGLVGSVPRGAGFDATFVGGLEVAATPWPWLAIGARDLGGSGLLAPNDTWSVGGAPFAELAWRFDDTWSIHGQLGIDLRVLGGAIPPDLAVAPLVTVGGRVQILRELSLAAQTGLHFAATDTWATALHALPRGAIVWTAGISIAVHL